MKKFKLLGLGLASALVLAACGSSGEAATNSDATNEEDKVVTIAASPDGYPQHYQEGDELKGFSVEVAEAVAEETGYEIDWALSDWSGVVAALQSGKADTAVNFANTNDTETNSLEDLYGETVNGVVGSNYAEVLKEYDPEDQINIEFVETMAVSAANIQSGKVKGYVNGYEELTAQIKNRDLDLRMIDETFGEKPVGFPFKDTEENQQIIEDFNAALQTLSEEGTLTDISNAYFGVDITQSKETE